MQKLVFEVVDSPIPGDPLAPLRMQSPAPNEWDQALYHAMSNVLAPNQSAGDIYDQLLREHGQPRVMSFDSLEDALDFLFHQGH